MHTRVECICVYVQKAITIISVRFSGRLMVGGKDMYAVCRRRKQIVRTVDLLLLLFVGGFCFFTVPAALSF